MKVKRLKGRPSDDAQQSYFRDIKVVKDKDVLPSKGHKEETYLPLKRFKGTKWNDNEISMTEIKDNNQNNKRKGVVDFTEDSHSNTKSQSHESYNFMSKLEQFSDVWNDCPSVSNPKANVESWYSNNAKPLIGNKVDQDYNKTYKKHKSKNEFDSDNNSMTLSSKPKEKEKSIKSLQRQEIEQINLSQGENSKKSKESKYPTNLQDKANHECNISDLKRKKAIQEHNQLHDNKKNIIQQALSSMDGKGRPNKKIVFDDAEEHVESKIRNGRAKQEKGTLRQNLFEDNDSDVESDFKLNHQFKGRKGQKLLELQSKFASDSRFAMDTRFYESGSDEGENSEHETSENVDHEVEKKKQLEILESIVKQPIKPLSEMKWKKAAFSDETYLRFDPTREDHQKYIITQPDKKKQDEDNSEKRKKKNKKDPDATSTVEANKTKVTTEKFVAVKEDLREALRKDEGTEFSLLKLFGHKDSDNSASKADESQLQKKLKYGTKNPFKYDSSESEPEEETKTVLSKKGAIKKDQAKALWRTTFFFTENDPRLEEAFEFLKCPEEQDNNKEYAEKRKVLKDFIRHKFKNNNRKRTLFKKKLGGFKKKVITKNKGKLS